MSRLITSCTRRFFLRQGALAASLAAGGTLAFPALATGRAMTAYRNPGCGCCGKWAKTLEAGGIAVTMIDDHNLAARREKAGVPAKLAGCHTAFLENYVIEGHVPLREIERLLAEKPVALGLAVAGMPIGSPGMEMGPETEPYDVVLFEAGGATRIYASYG